MGKVFDKLLRVLYQINKYLLQIARIFLRSQPTPRPSPSQEGKLGGLSQN
ncbi:hypothetical protein [Okeania sp. SIO2B9]|nr:hypothetical protein [Okeania sp. SIO2B9]